MKTERKVNISVNIPVSLYTATEEQAKKEHKTKNYLVTEVLNKQFDKKKSDKKEEYIFDFKKELNLILNEDAEILTALANK